MAKLPQATEVTLERVMHSPFDAAEKAIYAAVVRYGATTATATRFVHEMRREHVILEAAYCPRCYMPVIVKRGASDYFAYTCISCGKRYERKVERSWAPPGET